MIENRFEGRRYVCLVRCSTNEQADTSIPDQLNLLRAFAEQRGMIPAGGDVILDGVSGSRPGARSDIEQIILRKQQRNDFDVLLVQDMSRLTRGGIEHGNKVEYDLNAAGIEPVFASGTAPEGDHAGIVKSVEYFAAQQYAKSVSFAVARGQMSALLDGRMIHCLRPPYGTDRLYLSIENKPLHIIRNLSDRSQQKLTPDGSVVLETYPPAERGQANLRYRKQKSERLVLIPGSPEQVAAVRQMFRRRLLDGWGPWRIGKELNDQGIRSPNGKPWNMQTIKLMLRNPVYTGRGIANRRSQALYHTRSANAPAKAAVSRQDRATRKQPKDRRRPRSEWIEQPHPALIDFLGPDLRVRAIAFQAEYLTDRPIAPAIKPDKHVDSKFILKDILHSKQGHHRMTGRTQGTKDKPYRYYHISTACRIPTSDKTMRRAVQAEPIERAVLGAVRNLLMSHDSLRAIVAAAVRRQIESQTEDAVDLDGLGQQRNRVEKQIEFVIDELADIGKDAAKRKIRQLETQLTDLDSRIAKVSADKPNNVINEGEAVEKIFQRLAALADQFDTLPPHSLRSLLAVLISRLEVDMQTLTVELELRLPIWANFQPNFDAEPSALGCNSLQRVLVEAQRTDAFAAAAFQCVPQNRGCYHCQRRAA